MSAGPVESYLARLDAALSAVREPDRADLVADVRAYLDDAVGSGTAPEEAVASLGEPDVLARRLQGRESGEEPAPVSPDDTKRILGMPYNFGRLSAEEIASRVWNPADPRIFMPRVWGVGWTLNFGAIAVRLGLVRPDDEEPMPFANVPNEALAAGLAAVTALTAVAVVAAVVFRDTPRPFPVHWGFAGPDGFASPLSAALQLLGPVVVLDALAVFRVLAGGASRTERALTVAGLTLAVVMLGGLWTAALGWALTGREPFPSGLPIVAGLLAAFAVVVTYSRLGLRAEWRRARLK